jgi:hypothetical protein
MTLQMLVYMVNRLKQIQSELRTTELLQGLTLVYEMTADEHSAIQKEFYKLSHPAMEGYEEKEMFQAELLDVNFIFTKKPIEKP